MILYGVCVCVCTYLGKRGEMRVCQIEGGVRFDFKLPISLSLLEVMSLLASLVIGRPFQFGLLSGSFHLVCRRTSHERNKQ